MKRKITTRKYMGNDAYSWAVFADGRPIITGLSKTEAAYHKQQLTMMYNERGNK